MKVPTCLVHDQQQLEHDLPGNEKPLTKAGGEKVNSFYDALNGLNTYF